jgi:hypothetical protein
MSSALAATRVSALSLLLALPGLAQRPAAANADAILEGGREEALTAFRSAGSPNCSSASLEAHLTRQRVHLENTST